MTERNTTETPLATTTVKALVTLTVTPREDQTPEAAAAEMLVLFTEYLTVRDNTFLTDYGTTTEELVRFRAGELDEAPTWGGYEGPYVLEATVTVPSERV